MFFEFGYLVYAYFLKLNVKFLLTNLLSRVSIINTQKWVLLNRHLSETALKLKKRTYAI